MSPRAAVTWGWVRNRQPLRSAPADVGRAQVGAEQVRRAEVDAAQVGADQVGAAQARVPEAGPAQVPAHEVGAPAIGRVGAADERR